MGNFHCGNIKQFGGGVFSVVPYTQLLYAVLIN